MIHFAGLKAAVNQWSNRCGMDVNLCGSSACSRHGCPRVPPWCLAAPALCMASRDIPAHRKHIYGSVTYAQTKLAVEQLLTALSSSGPWRVASLRYFNPVGAHPSGRIGEDPYGIPNNLFPFITQIAAGRLASLRVFGNDYPTPDGTGIRDYLHVMDLAEAHTAAVEHLLEADERASLTLNLGTGKGLSVLEVLKGFEAATGITIPFEIVERRPGDVPKLEACPKRAEEVLGWTAKRSLADMCRDGWAWQSANPNGYHP